MLNLIKTFFQCIIIIEEYFISENNRFFRKNLHIDIDAIRSSRYSMETTYLLERLATPLSIGFILARLFTLTLISLIIIGLIIVIYTCYIWIPFYAIYNPLVSWIFSIVCTLITVIGMFILIKVI